MVEESINNVQIDFCKSNDESDNKYLEKFKTKEIEIISNDSQLSETSLNKFRKNYYPICEGIPNIVCACEGLIFYIIDRKLNYL